MRVVEDLDDGIRLDPIADELRDWLERWRLSFYRFPGLDIVSEFGEDRAGFRRRVLGVLRPAVQERLEEMGEAPRPIVPWLRRSRMDQRHRVKTKLASEVSGLVDTIEEHICRGLVEAVRRIEVGILLIPDGLELEPPTARNLMI